MVLRGGWVLLTCGILILIMQVLGGCLPDPLSEERLARSLEEFESYRTPDAKISSLVITKRQTNKDDKTDIIYCQVRAKNDRVEYTTLYRIKCSYFEKGGWAITSAAVDNLRDWKVKPIAGVTLDRLKTDLMSDSNSRILPVIAPYQRVTITKQETDLDQGRDSVIAYVEHNHQLLSVKGSGLLKYVFRWNVDLDNWNDLKKIGGDWVLETWASQADYSVAWNLVGRWYGSITKYGKPTGFGIWFRSMGENGEVKADVMQHMEPGYSSQGQLKGNRLTMEVVHSAKYKPTLLTATVYWAIDVGRAVIVGRWNGDSFEVSRE